MQHIVSYSQSLMARWSLSGMDNNQIRVVLAFALAILILGGNWPVMKAGLEHITPFWFAAVRFLFGGACLFLLQTSTGALTRPKRQDVPILLSVGLVQMAMFTALGAIAMLSVSAGRSAVLGYTTPLWMVPVALWVFKERFSHLQMLGTAIGLVGVLIMLNPFALDWSNTAEWQGNGLLLICSLGWALSSLHVRYHRSELSAYQLAPWQMLIASVCLLPLAYVLEGPFTGDLSASFWWVILYVGPVATAFSFVAINAAGRVLSAPTLSNAMLGVPVTGLITSVVFLGEDMPLSLMLGGMVILAGILSVSLGSKMRR